MGDTNKIGGFEKFFSGLSEVAELLRRAHKIRNARYPAAVAHLDELTKLSWFVSLNLGFSDYESLLAWHVDAPSDPVEREAFIDERFITCYREYAGYLANQASKQFPFRAHIIKSAMQAHERGDYALSVPVFFSQAEGIIRETINAELFSKTNRHAKNVADVANASIPEITQLQTWIDYADAAHWTQLKGPLPLAYNQNERDIHSYSGINRNTVLHGIDCDYATEKNSFKAFSLLCHGAGIAMNLERVEAE